MKKLLLMCAVGATLVFWSHAAYAQEDMIKENDELFSEASASPEKSLAVPALGATPSTTQPYKDSYGSFYLSGSGGIGYLTDSDNTGPSGLNVDSNHERGYQFAGALGLRINKDFRVETELAYRINDADSLTVNGVGGLTGLSAAADGKITAMSLMLNGYGDMDIFAKNGSMNYIKPYIMGGVGMARIDADVSGGGVQMVDDDDTAFAYQIGLGLGYSFSETTSLDLGYRYFAVSNLEFNDAAGNPFDSEYNNHVLLVGLRHEFR